MDRQTRRNFRRGDLGIMQRIGASLADWSEQWFPDAYVFAGLAVAIVCAAALAMGRGPMQISVDFGKSFWNLIPFSMQMAFVVIGGYIVAVSAPVRRAIEVLARFPQSPKVAVAYVACLAIVTSLLSWGFSMILIRVDHPLLSTFVAAARRLVPVGSRWHECRQPARRLPYFLACAHGWGENWCVT
jgi:hypothetical protein